MTRYTVIWDDDASEDVAEWWLAFPNPASVNAACQRVQELLSRDAPERGSAYHEGLRVLDSPPFRVLFSVEEADRIARVLRVYWYESD